MNLIALLDDAALRTPNAPAIIDGPLGGERITSFADLRTRSGQIASLLACAGVRCGDGIVILIPMSVALYEVIAAALRLGAVPVFIEPEHATAQLERCRNALPLKAFVGSPLACLWRLLKPELRAIKTAFVTQGWFPGTTPLGTARRMPPIEQTATGLDNAPAMLTFTSGSTGAAKGLLRNHRLLLDTQEILVRHLDLRLGSINLSTMPAFVLANLGHGVTSLIPDGDLRRPASVDPVRIAMAIDHWKVESLLASPALVENLADHCIARSQTLNSLCSVFMGGAPVFPRIMDKAVQTAQLARVVALYGSTEAEPIALLAHNEITQRARAAIAQGAGLPAGEPIREIKLEILNDNWGQPLGAISENEMRNLILPPRAHGEIVVSGHHVAKSYLNGLGDADTKFRVGNEVWHRTGDSGWLDEQNRLWLTGRCSIRVGEPPHVVYPLMVEAALADHPHIARAAFVNHCGEHLLVLELKRGTDSPGLEWLAKALPWAGIDRVVTLPHIPVDKRHNAKIDYPGLQLKLSAKL